MRSMVGRELEGSPGPFVGRQQFDVCELTLKKNTRHQELFSSQTLFFLPVRTETHTIIPFVSTEYNQIYTQTSPPQV